MVFISEIARKLFNWPGCKLELPDFQTESLMLNENWNEVLFLTETETKTTVQVASLFTLNRRAVVSALKKSWMITTGEAARNLGFDHDKVLAHKTLDEMKAKLNILYSMNGINVFEVSSDGKKLMVCFTQQIKRVVCSVRAVQLLGGNRHLVNVVCVLGENMGWKHEDLQIDEGIQLTFPQRILPNKHWSYDTLESRIWNAMIEKINCFEILAWNAYLINDPSMTILCYQSLSLISQLSEDPGAVSSPRPIVDLDSLTVSTLTPFTSWVIACVCAKCLTSRYSQLGLEVAFFGKSTATQIHLKSKKLRSLNRKICKHVFQEDLSPSNVEAVINKSGANLFNELSSKWKRYYRHHTTIAFQALDGYLRRFRKWNQSMLLNTTGVQKALETYLGTGLESSAGQIVDSVELKAASSGEYRRYYRNVLDNLKQHIRNVEREEE